MSGFAPFRTKMEAEGLPEIAIRTFEAAYERLASGESGTIPESSIEPVASLPAAGELEAHRARGEQALGRAVVIKLNGGLGTSMGMTRAKSLLPAKNGASFLELTARQLRALGEAHGETIPLVLMNSFRTRDDSLAALAGFPGLSGPLAPDFVQHKVPRIRADDLSPVSWPDDPAQEWCPPGHGDLYPALVTSGMLEALLDGGFRTAFVSNADNLGAVLDPAILGWFVESGAPFAMEVKERGPADRKGGHLAARADGEGLVLREIAQCPEADLDAFQDIERHRFFNTNNLWLDLVALRDALAANEGVLALPMIRNRKTVDPRDPSTPAVIQIETAMGAAISVFPGARAVVVGADRFVPVKTTNDLLGLWSDAFAVDAGSRVVAIGPSTPLVTLDATHYKTVDGLEAHFPRGAPSLRDCRSFEVRGSVRFGRDVVVRGDVVVDAATQPVVADGAVLEG